MPWSRSAAPEPHRWLTARPYAHRGLHGPGVPENSRAAFRAAIAAGFGIELDVRASRCGTAFVFHDRTLERLCGAAGSVDAMDRAALAATGLLHSSDETIPTLVETLELIAGRSALLIELKSHRPTNRALCSAVAHALRTYRGPAAVMSFDPTLLRWFHHRAPRIPRGLVITEEQKSSGPAARRLAMRLGKPDFLAYDIRSLPSGFAARQRTRGLPVLTWTVRSTEERERARHHADQIIHELPAEQI